MNTAIYIGADWIYYFFRVLFCFKYLNLLFPRKKTKSIPYICAILLACIDAANLFTGTWVFSNTLFFGIMFVNILFNCCYYKGKLSGKIDITILYYVIAQFLDLLVTTILFIILGKSIVSQGIVRSIFLIGSILLWMFLYFLLRKPISYFRWNVSTLWMWAFNGIGILAIIYFQRIYLAEMPKGMMSAWLFFLIYSAFMFCLLALYIFRQESQKKLSLVEIKKELLEKNYNNLLLIYKENARLFHDFKAHFRTLRNYLQNQEIEKGIKYIDSTIGPIKKVDKLVWTGNELIDLILNCKMLEATENGIRIEIEADKLGNLAIPDSDLCVILSNLIENAIENCGGKHIIEITVKQRNHLLILVIKNSIKDSMNKANMKTWKENKTLHGIGLDSVKLSVEKNQGSFEYNNDGVVFESLVMLPIETNRGQNSTV